MARPPRYELKNSADSDRFFRDLLVKTVGPTELKPGAITTPAVAGATAASNGTFYVKRSGDLSFDTIGLSDLPGTVATDTEVAAAIAAHVAASDPHPVYLSQAEGDARYRELTDAVTYAELTGKPAALARLFSGTGTPEGNVTAGVGSLYLRTDGGAGTTLYVKESGASDTGWAAK